MYQRQSVLDCSYASSSGPSLDEVRSEVATLAIGIAPRSLCIQSTNRLIVKWTYCVAMSSDWPVV